MASTKNHKLNDLLQAAIDARSAGRIAHAIELLDKNAAAYPRAAKLWGYLGFLYTEAGNDTKAVLCFRKTITLSPHSEQASLGLFHGLWRLAKTNAAFDEMRRFVKSNDSPRYRELIRGMLEEAPTRPDNTKERLAVA